MYFCQFLIGILCFFLLNLRSRFLTWKPRHYSCFIVKIFLLINGLFHFLYLLLTILGYEFYLLEPLINYFSGSAGHANHLSGHQKAGL